MMVHLDNISDIVGLELEYAPKYNSNCAAETGIWSAIWLVEKQRVLCYPADSCNSCQRKDLQDLASASSLMLGYPWKEPGPMKIS